MSAVAAVLPAVTLRPAVYLYPGQVIAAAVPTRISTIVGSCIAVCLWDARRGIGGMNHYVLPEALPEHAPSARFARFALDELLARLLCHGSGAPSLKAKVFGGSAMMSQLPGNLGSRNIDVARRWLGEHRIEIVAESVGGTRGRKIAFHTDDGSVAVREL